MDQSRNSIIVSPFGKLDANWGAKLHSLADSTVYNEEWEPRPSQKPRAEKSPIVSDLNDSRHSDMKPVTLRSGSNWSDDSKASLPSYITEETHIP